MVNILCSVIPLDDLPELKVGYGFGLVDKETLPKPTYLKVIYNMAFFCVNVNLKKERKNHKNMFLIGSNQKKSF